jgi:nucleotide-binding universal stress UspA family protein
MPTEVTNVKRFDNILLVLDPAKPCASLVERAVAVAENNQASLKIVAVVPQFVLAAGLPLDGLVTLDLQARFVADQTDKLEALVAPFRERLSIGTKVLTGTPFLEVVREVLRGGHDLVIRAAENPGWLDRLLGSDDMHLLRKCPCPVWLVRCEAPMPYRRVLAAVDVDDSYAPDERATRHALNREVLELASALALSEFAELHVASAWDAIGESFLRGAFMHTPDDAVAAYVEQSRQRNARSLDVLMEELTEFLGKDAVGYLEPKTHLVKGGARREIPALAQQLEVDLVVMGTVARTGIPGVIMGNTAEAILGQLDCSVLAIKPPGFVTPVSLQD